MKMLKQQGIILQPEINNTKSPFGLGPLHCFPGYKVSSFLFF
jgi:hypothetical protein